MPTSSIAAPPRLPFVRLCAIAAVSLLIALLALVAMPASPAYAAPDNCVAPGLASASAAPVNLAAADEGGVDKYTTPTTTPD